jgi:hypothetical protein
MSLLSGSATKVTHPDGSLLLWHQASCWGVLLVASPGLPWAVVSSSFVGCLRVVWLPYKALGGLIRPMGSSWGGRLAGLLIGSCIGDSGFFKPWKMDS